MTEPDFGGCTDVARAHAIEQLHALATAATAEMLAIIAAANRAEDYRGDGCLDMAQWLTMDLKVSTRTAREWVRVANALEELPRLRAAYATGGLSWDQLAQVTRFAGPTTDEWLARIVPTMTARQVELMADRRRVRTQREATAAKDDRAFRWTRDRERDGYRYFGYLPAEQAEIVNGVLSRRAEAAGPNATTGVWDPFQQRVADALTDLALADHQVEPKGDPALVVVHVDAEVLDGTVPGNGETAEGQQVPSESVRRLLCDGEVELQAEGPDGTCVGVGRAERTPPRWLRRRILKRDDGTCRFPGCGRVIRHVHHLQHWTAGGPTDSWNLCGLCWEHHHLVHEGGWGIEGNADGGLTFVGPSGRRLTKRPPPLDREVRRRAEGTLPPRDEPPAA